MCGMALWACTEAPNTNDWRRIVEADRLVYLARWNDDQACAAALDAITLHRDAFADFFAVTDRLSGVGLHYHKYRDQRDFQANSGCDDGADGCFDGTARSWLAVDTHELAHAWVRAVYDVRTRYVSEGIATSLSCRPFIRSLGNSGKIADPFGLEGPVNYHAMSRFVTHLLSLDAASVFVAWAEAIDRAGGTELAADSATQNRYGRTLQQIWAEALSPTATQCFALGRCNADPLPLGTARLGSSCAGQNAYRLSGDSGPALGIRAVGVAADVLACAPNAPDYELRTTGIGDAQTPGRAEYIFATPDTEHLITLTADDPSTETILYTRALPGAFSPHCTEDAPIELARSHASRLVLPRRVGTYFFPLAFSGAALLGRLVEGSAESASSFGIRWCDTCGTECVTREWATNAVFSDSGLGILELAVTRVPPTPAILELELLPQP
jgi:hypothetical protein